MQKNDLLLAFFVFFLLLPSIGHPLAWHITTVETPTYFTEMGRYMAIDSMGNPHFAYGGDHLYYAAWNGTRWEKVTVDSAPAVGEYASIALDPSGNPHIAYYDALNMDLKYAYYDGTSWHVQDVDTQGNVGKYASLALDARGNPHIAYLDATNSILKYAHFNGSYWQIEIVDSEPGAGSQASLALDPDGRPHIAYLGFYVSTGSQVVNGNIWLKYAYYDGSNWHIETVDAIPNQLGGINITTPSLDIDASGRPQIAYVNRAHSELKYASYNGEHWEITRISFGNFLRVSFALNPSGMPGLFYYESENLEYAYYDGNSIKPQTVASVGWDADYLVLSFDPQGIPHVAFMDGPYLKYGRFNGTSWDIEVVDTRSDVGKDSSLSLDSSGNPYILYKDSDARKLRLAHYNGTSWEIEPLNTLGISDYFSLDLDRYGRPHVAFQHDSQLKYAYFNGNSWKIETADPGEEQGWKLGSYNSLVIDRNGKPHISYYDWTLGVLKYAYLKGSTWHSEVVDEEWGTGRYTSLAIDRSGRAYIAYYDYHNHDLKLAKQQYNAGWKIETIDSSGNVGLYASLALDPSGKPHIAYVDADHGDLKYAYYNGRSWRKETVDSDGIVGAFASLKVDASGVVHIAYYAYYDSTNRRLKYARLEGGTWQIETVDSNGAVGSYCDLEIDSSGNPYISYYDLANHDLKFAYGTPNQTENSYNLNIRALKCQGATSGGAQTCIEASSFSSGDHLRLELCIENGPARAGLVLDEYIAVLLPSQAIYFLTQDPNAPVVLYDGGAITPSMAFKRGLSDLNGCNGLFEFNIPRDLSGTFKFLGVFGVSGQGLSASSLLSNIAAKTLYFGQ